MQSNKDFSQAASDKEQVKTPYSTVDVLAVMAYPFISKRRHLLVNSPDMTYKTGQMFVHPSVRPSVRAVPAYWL